MRADALLPLPPPPAVGRGAGGRRGPSWNTPRRVFLVPESPRYFWLPSPTPFRSPCSLHREGPTRNLPGAPTVQHHIEPSRENGNPAQISLLSLRRGEPPAGDVCPVAFPSLRRPGHLLASHGSGALPPAKHPSSLSPGGPAPRRLYRARSARSPPIGNRCTLPQLL
jgi:hypothetical protein